MVDKRWNSAPDAPVDQTLLQDTAEIDWNRPLYRCAACRRGGDFSLHRYLDDCPYFVEEPAPAAAGAQSALGALT